MEKIKDTLDPNGILAPGKQGIWPNRFRHLRETQEYRGVLDRTNGQNGEGQNGKKENGEAQNGHEGNGHNGHGQDGS